MRLVVCFVVYGLILPIYNGSDAVVPPPHRNVNLPKELWSRVQRPMQRAPHSSSPSKNIPNVFCKKDAINLKPQERKRCVVQSHFSKAASQGNHTNQWKRHRFLWNEAKCEEGKKKRLISNFQHVSNRRQRASIWKIETVLGSEKGQASWPLEGKK